MPTTPPVDPVVSEIRELITETDRQILDAANRRLELVIRLHRHKAERGYPMVDAAREESLLRDLAARNRGPLSDEAVRRLFRTLIEISKEEARSERAVER